jgi:hypothetical protein
MADASGAAPPSAPRTPQQVAQMMAPDAHAQAAKDALVAKIRQIPGLDDGQRGELFVKQWSLIRPEEAEYARRYIEDQRETHRDVRDDVRAERTDARIDYRDQLKRADEDRRAKLKFGPVQEITDSSGKKTYVQYNEVGDMRPVKVPEGSTLSKVGSRGANTAPLDEARAKFWAEVLAKGGTLPAGLRRSGVVEQVMRAMPGESEGVTPGDFISRHSEVQANTGSLRNMTRMADSAISFEKLAEKNFDVALKLAPDAVPTDLGPFFNQWIEKGETMLGDPNVPPYVAAMLTGANEYAKVMSGSTGTAASTNDSRRQAAEMFSPYFSLPQISQVIAVAKADMKNRENTLTEQVSQIKQRLGSSAPVTIAPAATPRATGQESQSAPPSGGVIKLDADGNVIQQ